MTTPVITLTFDNGPTPGITEPVLDLLAAHSVPAVFFAIGQRLASHEGRQLGRRAVSEGHRAGRPHLDALGAVRCGRRLDGR